MEIELELRKKIYCAYILHCLLYTSGIQVSRHGMAVCPFPTDKNPSMKVDKRFHCFACQADGDAVDFVSRLFGLPSKAAAMKLADDFGISYDNMQKHRIKPHIREPTPEQRYRQEESRCYRVLSDYFHHLRTWKQQYAPKQPEDEWHPLFGEALQRESLSLIHIFSHYVKTSVLEAAILQAIQAVSKYVLENEDEFIQQLKAVWNEQQTRTANNGSQELAEACLLYTSMRTTSPQAFPYWPSQKDFNSYISALERNSEASQTATPP